MFAPFFQWTQETAFFSYLRGSAYAYPILLWAHLVALVCLGAMVLVTDLRLLGLGMKGSAVADLVSGLRVPKRLGIAVVATSGVLLFGAKAAQYSDNRWFWIKAVLVLLNSLLLRRIIYRHGSELYGKAKLAGALSLLLWMGAVCAARGPATVKDIMHSVVDPSGDFLFHSVRTIADEHGVREIAPHTDAEWDEVRQHLKVLLDAPNLLQGRRAARPRDRSKNPQVESEPEDIQKLLDKDAATFVLRAQKLRDAASAAMKAVDQKDKAAFLRGLDGIDKACESCHLRYWYPNDKRAHEAAKQDGVVE
jgi:hypothetical protein